MGKNDMVKNIDELFITFGNGVIYEGVICSTEKILIEKALEKAFGNQSIAAKILGITRNTLRAKVEKYGIDCRKYKI